MMTTLRLADALPSLILLALTGLFLLCFSLKVRAQQDRLKLAEMGKRLLASGDLSPELRSRVIFCLDHAFGLRLFLLASLLLLPFATIYYVAKHDFSDVLEEDLKSLPPETAKLFRQFDNVDTKLFLANNPILVAFSMLIVGVSITVVWVVVLLWKAVRLVAGGAAQFPASTSLLERVLGLVLLRMGETLEVVNHRVAHAGHRLLPRGV